MIYIIEGPDGSGKTTLVNELLTVHPAAEVLHFGAPATEEEAKNYWRVYMHALHKMQGNPGKVLIFDRSWYSDMVYGPIMRGRNELEDIYKEALELAVIALGGGIVIYCTGKPSVLWSRCQKRGETYITSAAQHKAICEMYDKVIQQIKELPVIYYNTTAQRKR